MIQKRTYLTSMYSESFARLVPTIPHDHDIMAQDLPFLSPSKSLKLTGGSANGTSAESLEMFCHFVV